MLDLTAANWFLGPLQPLFLITLVIGDLLGREGY